jgi:hypothetical protein
VRESPLRQTELNRLLGEVVIVLLAGKALLLRGGDDLAVAEQDRGGVVEKKEIPKMCI